MSITWNSQKFAAIELLISIVVERESAPMVYVTSPKSESLQMSASQGSAIDTASKYELDGSVFTAGAVKLKTI